MVISHGDFFFLQSLPFPTIISSWYIAGEGASFPSTYEGRMSTCVSASIPFTVSSSLCHSVRRGQLLSCFILMINLSQIWPGGPFNLAPVSVYPSLFCVVFVGEGFCEHFLPSQQKAPWLISCPPSSSADPVWLPRPNTSPRKPGSQ